jgi:hypothetical protein
MTIKESLKKLGATKRKVAPNIYLISFDDSENMCKTLLRFAEHYESPKFRNKIFTLKEFKAWYKTTRNGKFTYYKDWAGFNVPSYVFTPFKQKKFSHLTQKEKLFLNLIHNLKEPFYIIVAKKNSSITIQHEMAHALFYLNKKYRSKAIKILSTYDMKEINEELLSNGYCKEVLLDEANAYASGGCEWLIKAPNLSKKLKALFNKYINKTK